mmetsp:Transcript_12117/g.18695  ORF Transcript_12117/g.18695 Transcript_12117/m.18695 type:complete len:119 (+) Transcript_12117:1018-1374(+)
MISTAVVSERLWNDPAHSQEVSPFGMELSRDKTRLLVFAYREASYDLLKTHDRRLLWSLSHLRDSVILITTNIAWVLPVQDAGLYTHQRTLDIRFVDDELKLHSAGRIRGATHHKKST